MRFCVQAQHEGGSRTEEFQINQKGIQETGRYEPFRESDAYLLFFWALIRMVCPDWKTQMKVTYGCVSNAKPFLP